MEAAEFFETSLTFYQTAWRHIPQDCCPYISGETIFSNINKDLLDK
jgi:hypothetical protein